MVEITKNIELSKMGWLKFPKTLKCSKSDVSKNPKTLKNAKSDGWNYRKHRTTAKSDGWSRLKPKVLKIWWLKLQKTLELTQNLMVEIAENIKCSKSDRWSCLKHFSAQNLMRWRSLKPWRTQNLMVETCSKHCERLQIWWLKLPKTLKNEKSDGWSIIKILELWKIWWLKLPKTKN